MLIGLLWRYVRPYRLSLIVISFAQLCGTAASLYLPSLNADIIDNGIAQGDASYVLAVGGWMLLLTLAHIIVVIVTVRSESRLSAAFGRDLRAAVFCRIGALSAREVSQIGASSLITRTTNDVQQAQTLVTMIASALIPVPLVCVGGIVMSFRQDASLSWLVVASVPILLLGVVLIGRRMVPHFRAMQERLDCVNRVLRQQIGGVRVIRAFVRETHEMERFAAASRAFTDSALRVGLLMALIFPFVMFVLHAASAAALWFGGLRVDENQMRVGALIAVVSYLAQILMAVMSAAFTVMMVPRAAVSSKRIAEVLELRSSLRPRAEPVADVPRQPGLELEGVGFRFPGAEEPVLDQVSFRVGPDKALAIVGSTGAGKTTLINLIPRLIDVTTGAVRLGGVDVRDVEPRLLRERIGLAPQRAYLFSGTVASNLRHGKPDATDDELWEALEVAQARDFVEAMPGGLNAPIVPAGANVSGGQRQRLAIARALARKPDVYLFDDSFSALDLSTEARLRVALRQHAAGAIMLLVAQRVSTITWADQIVVLDQGVVVGRGTHEELRAGCGAYAEIVASQLSGEEAA